MKVNNSFAPQIAQKQTFSAAITSAAMQNMMLKSLRDERAVARITSTLISAVSASDQLKNCEPSTIVAAALRGEGMGLIFGNGYYVVPYGTVATYILG